MRKLSVTLIVLGAFLIVLAPMLRFYLYPRLAAVPAAQDSVTTLVGPNATIFDIGSLSEITTDLTTKVRTVGDVKAAEKEGHNVVVWVNSTSTRSADGVMRGRSVERSAFNATTAEAVDCCGTFISDEEGVNTPVAFKGLVVKFPFRTEKKTYNFWDGDLREAVPIEYKRTTEIDGVKVYEFSQTIPPTQVGDREMPLTLLGLPGDETVTAQSMYSNTRTLWVEPVTGIIIKRTEAQHNTIDYLGEPRITTTNVTTGYDDATVKKNAEEYGPLASQLNLLRNTAPLIALVIGLLALIGGLVLARRPAPRSV